MSVSTAGALKSANLKARQSRFGADIEELVGNTAEKKNWKGIFIALLVIIVVISLVIVAIVLLTPSPVPEDNRERFTLADYFSDHYQPKHFYHSWVKSRDEDVFYYRDADGALYMFNCSANETSSNRRIQLMDNKTFRELNTGTFFVSADRKFVLLQHDEQRVYRHSRLSKYSIFNVEQGVYVPFNPPGSNDSRFQYVGWSPKGHNLVYVQGNNIYFLTEPNYDSRVKPVQLTSDGLPGNIYNGIPDWVYEEEILASDHAIWWSPDGNFILYAVFDDTKVRKFYYPFYGDMRHKYGEARYIPYPKPGYRNPSFTLKVYDIKRKNTSVVTHPDNYKDRGYYEYFTSVAWRDNNFFLVAYLNRPQNVSLIQACKAINGHCKVNQKETAKGGWVDLYKPPLFTQNGKRYFWILPSREGKAGYFKHIASVEFPVSNTDQLTPDEGLRTTLTGGTMDAMEIVGYNEELERVYYIAAPDPRQRHLYSVNSNSSHTNIRQTTCLTCNYDKKCQYVMASFSCSGRYYILGCLGPGVPFFVLKSTSNSDETILESNEALKNRLVKKALPKVEYFKIPVSNQEYIHGKLLLPPQINKDRTYSILMRIYGGPGSQRVTEQFRLNWETYLCSSNNIIIAYVDPRGTGARGLQFLHSIYKQLGTLEVKDTIAAGNFFDKLPYVESSKMAIWGWSYGGFLTASVLGSRDPPNPFDCGIAVAPVTDWNYYDSVYTERYMNTPFNNPEGYKLSNVSRHAANFNNSRFLLIHGTGDDNVHFQNSAQLMKALVEANVYFRSQIYTDQQHSLNAGNTKRHLYETMGDFLNECFHGKSKKFELKNKLLQQTKQEPIEE